MYKKLLTTSVVSLSLLAGASNVLAATAEQVDKSDKNKPIDYVAVTAYGVKPPAAFYGDPPGAGRWDGTPAPIEALGGCTGDKMEAGTVIKADNFDSVKDLCFEGKRVGDMVTENVEWMIREKNLMINTRHSE